MSDEKPKPFARTTGAAHGYLTLFVADQLITSAPIESRERDEVAEMATRINAAVEQREARLRGRLSKLRLVAAELGDAARHLIENAAWAQEMVPRIHRLNAATDHLVDALLEELDDADDYVTGDVACGLAWDLGAERAKVKQLQTLWEALADCPPDNIVAFLRGAGVPEKKPEDWSDEELERRTEEVARETVRRESRRAAHRIIAGPR